MLYRFALLVIHVSRQLMSILNRVKIKRVSGFWMHVKYFDICTSSFNADKVRNLGDDLSVLVRLCRYWSFSLSIKALWKHLRSKLRGFIQTSRNPMVHSICSTLWILSWESRLVWWNASFINLFPVPLSRRTHYFIDWPQALCVIGNLPISALTAILLAYLLIFEDRLQNSVWAFAKQFFLVCYIL